MICHSYMTPKALGTLLFSGRLIGNQDYVDKKFIKAYDWMKRQMELCLGPFRYHISDITPLWVWHTWEGKLQSYPSVRNLSYERMQNPGGVYRVTLDIPDNFVLLSNFDTWHAVLTLRILQEMKKN